MHSGHALRRPTWTTSSTTRRTARSAAIGSASTSRGRACCCSAWSRSGSCSTPAIGTHRRELSRRCWSSATLGLLGLGASTTLRAGAVNLALGPVAAAAALYYAEHGSEGVVNRRRGRLLLGLAWGASPSWWWASTCPAGRAAWRRAGGDRVDPEEPGPLTVAASTTPPGRPLPVGAFRADHRRRAARRDPVDPARRRPVPAGDRPGTRRGGLGGVVTALALIGSEGWPRCRPCDGRATGPPSRSSRPTGLPGDRPGARRGHGRRGERVRPPRRRVRHAARRHTAHPGRLVCRQRRLAHLAVRAGRRRHRARPGGDPAGGDVRPAAAHDDGPDDWSDVGVPGTSWSTGSGDTWANLPAQPAPARADQWGDEDRWSSLR